MSTDSHLHTCTKHVCEAQDADDNQTKRKYFCSRTCYLRTGEGACSTAGKHTLASHAQRHTHRSLKYSAIWFSPAEQTPRDTAQVGPAQRNPRLPVRQLPKEAKNVSPFGTSWCDSSSVKSPLQHCIRDSLQDRSFTRSSKPRQPGSSHHLQAELP